MEYLTPLGSDLDTKLVESINNHKKAEDLFQDKRNESHAIALVRLLPGCDPLS